MAKRIGTSKDKTARAASAVASQSVGQGRVFRRDSTTGRNVEKALRGQLIAAIFRDVPSTGFADIEHKGVREYRQDLTEVIRREQPVVIERHGQPVGMYLPFKQRDREREAQLAATLTRSLADLRAGSGLSEEALAQLIEGALKDR